MYHHLRVYPHAKYEHEIIDVDIMVFRWIFSSAVQEVKSQRTDLPIKEEE